jgi:glycine/D-amino acid oxidase-like deaminating enzyme
MKIAIVGGGFCGLAATWNILQHSDTLPHLKVTLFDSNQIGHAASGISAGLLHPFSGAHAKLNWRGLEGLAATQELLIVAENTLGYPVRANNKGILRHALSAVQERDYQRCHASYPLLTQWLDVAACQELAPHSIKSPGLQISQGLTVYSLRYLQGLWQACAALGAHFEVRKIRTLDELSPYDAIILTTGAESANIAELSTLPIGLVKGQILELAWPSNLPPLCCVLNSHVYIAMTEGGKSCIVGATYEKGFLEAQCDLETAKKELLPKAYELFPPLRDAPLLNCLAGMRAVTAQHRPLIQKVGPKQWILTGMGSKGLLYHALFAKELVNEVVDELRR